ncbi:hypothetical protein CCAX7_54120 [Capsulimonas corticalis]|uniref:Uncharacterized protein n=1 Tax=Capsulimonas corticalis TaxID=2219043 RepID=A0A402CN81_9BACT|nr:hypothetical protein [Capsulimonas corticalis]BDI33361.1 hypothetical protein CCAX7_54120 [Capsulimonas corticalis]
MNQALDLDHLRNRMGGRFAHLVVSGGDEVDDYINRSLADLVDQCGTPNANLAWRRRMDAMITLTRRQLRIRARKSMAAREIRKNIARLEEDIVGIRKEQKDVESRLRQAEDKLWYAKIALEKAVSVRGQKR